MTAALVPLDGAQLAQLTPGNREAAVTQYLTGARDWLARAVEITGPEVIAAVKAEIATAAEATRQLNLSKEIQLDAQEMVRRAEYALGKAIRKGQDEGEFAPSVTVTGGGPGRQGRVETSSQPSVRQALGLHAQEQADMAALSSAAGDRFEEAVADAKAEQNLSRANVIRKIREPKKSADERSIDRLDRIATMAEGGYSSRQIAVELGNTPEWIRQLARDYDITIPADKITGKRRRIDSNRIVQQTVLDVASASAGLDLVEFPALDRTQIAEWANSLSESLRALDKFAKRLKKELTQP